MLRKALMLVVPAVLSAACAYGVEAENVRRGGDELVSNWHLGPFFEYRRTDTDATFWAVRPFWSQVRDSDSRTAATDVLWPVFTMHDHAHASWWSAFLLMNGDSRAKDPSWSFNFYPFWFSGVDRKDEGYWGFFPFYGNHPHFLLVDDLSYVLWPIWHSYEVKGVRSHAVCWPFVTWRDEPREGVGVWPFYGYGRQRESMHQYALWPLVTWASYDEDRDTSGAGYSWWCLPFYGEVRRARESQTMILPPFFSDTETVYCDESVQEPIILAKRLRAPWPFIELEASFARDRISIWPIWEQVRVLSYDEESPDDASPEELTWRFGWQLIENTVLESERTLEKRFNFFPFFTWERRYSKNTGRESGDSVQSAECKAQNEAGTAPGDSVRSAECKAQNEAGTDLVESYFRIWPFWSSHTVGGRTRQRTLELMPFRHSEGIERNWAPFWSLWERDERPDGRTRYSLLWNLISWQSE